MIRSFILFAFVLSAGSCGNRDSRNGNGNRDTIEGTSYARYTPDNTKVDSPTIADTNVARRPADGQEPPQDENTVRLQVSFLSRGMGIDHETKSDFDHWLKQRPHILFYVSPWGREGEMSYCFALRDMSPTTQDQIVADVRRFLAGEKMVYISEYTPCKK